MQPFIPHELPIKNLNWEKLVPLIGKANAAIARYDGLLQSLMNPSILLSPLIQPMRQFYLQKLKEHRLL